MCQRRVAGRLLRWVVLGLLAQASVGQFVSAIVSFHIGFDTIILIAIQSFVLFFLFLNCGLRSNESFQHSLASFQFGLI